MTPMDMSTLLRIFQAEADEHLRATEEALVSLEAHPDDEELLHGVFRAMHTLKGSAACIGLEAISELAHVQEELLERLRDRRIPVTRGVVTLLLAAVDALRQQVSSEASAGRSEPAVLGPVSGALQHATLRVDIQKLDALVDLAGEISIARGRLRQLLERGGRRSHEALEVHREADRLFHDLQEQVMRARMVPVGPLFRQYVRVVRDLTAARGKRAELHLEGEGVEIDARVCEQLKGPLTHMVRNAVDHGIEAPGERAARDKPPVGRIVLRAQHDAGGILVQVEDDGAGIDRERVLARGRALGLVQDGERLTDAEVLRLLFEPGFSTSVQVTELSGRGVGLDVVRRDIEALRGSVAISGPTGRGTTMTLRLPLTLAIIHGFVVGVGGATYVLPLDAVRECLDLPPEAAARQDPVGVLSLRGEPLPFLRLRHVLGGEGPLGRESVVVVQHEGGRAGLVVEHLHGESQTVIKPLGPLLRDVPGVSGSALREDGRVALIVDVSTLLRDAAARTAAAHQDEEEGVCSTT